MTKFLNIDLDTKLGGSTPSDVLVSSQKAIKTYVDAKLLEETTRAQGVEAGLNTRVSTNEDDIAMNKDEIGTLTTDMSTAKTDITNLKTSVNGQANLISDLQDSKQDKIDNLDTIIAGAAAGATAVQPSDLAIVATSGSYNDLSNKPIIPAAQVNSDWNATSGVAQILNKPTLGTAASKDATAFATAAQGAKADTAVQPSAIADMETKTHASATYQPKGDYALTSSVNAVETKVSGIEAKIPDSASADNKLATKADLENVGVAIDGTTITKKADGKIQASAVVNQNSGVLKSWTGTLAEYNALETKSDDTIYVITDDNSEGVNVYTKSEVDSLLNNKQDTLVSGTNIKTVNGESLLGSGNIKIESGSGGGVPVGTIFTTPRTGIIPGAVEANGGSYNIADYSGEGSIGALLTAGTLSYVSKTEFQTQVANTGACDSFGWNGAGETLYCWKINEPDGTGYTTSENPSVGDTVYYVRNNYTTEVVGYVTEVGSNETGSYIMWTDSSTVHYRTPSNDKTKAPDPTFLVPKLNPWHVGKNAPVVGNGMTVGLTDGTTNAGLGTNYTPSGYDVLSGTVNYGADVGTATTDGTLGAAKSIGITTDPIKSGMVADLSETTNLRVMVQLATGATDQALETCTSVLSDVSALNAHRVIEFQAPTAGNGYTWYRKYADGWVEQGGYNNQGGIAQRSTTLLVEMSNSNYQTLFTVIAPNLSGAGSAVSAILANTTTTGFTFVVRYGTNGVAGEQVFWQVSGMAA